jgi:hypothetical protein
MSMRFFFPLVAFLCLLCTVVAEEGMWLFSDPPRAQVRAAYGFEMTDGWLKHLMKSSVRFNSGGSGSFVSSDGLVITNHHVGADDIQKLSTAKKNYLRHGFLAQAPAEELKCVDLELNILQSIEDITERVNAAVPAAVAPAEAMLARRKIFAEIEKESLEKTGLRSDVVTLFKGGAFHLYRFKRYTDIRLVWAPEQDAAFFGGDPDNFEFPRFNLDACLFRAYENGEPARVEHYLRWSANGAAQGELTFVSGHPGRTNRQLTVAELKFLRDVQYPHTLNRIRRFEVLLGTWGARSAENSRRAQDDLFSYKNSRKVRDGEQAALYSAELFKAKGAAEETLQQKLRATSAANGSEPRRTPFDEIAEAQHKISGIQEHWRLLESGDAFTSESFFIARMLLRSADEKTKPNGERLNEFADARRLSFELELFSGRPIYPDLEAVKLASSLTQLVEQLGHEDPLVHRILAGQTPRERAAALIRETKVRDVAFRKALYAGDAAVVAAANDPMIELARIVDGEARELRRQWEAADEQKQQAHAAIERTRFELGLARVPDATFTLRLTYGIIEGYEEDGEQIPAFTRMGGIYERSAAHENREPFYLPERWIDGKARLDVETPFNFVSTHDIIGGNSGSPVVNRANEFIGLIFDGNIHSLGQSFAYDSKRARAVSVDSRAIVDALRKLYGAEHLASELLHGKRR